MSPVIFDESDIPSTPDAILWQAWLHGYMLSLNKGWLQGAKLCHLMENPYIQLVIQNPRTYNDLSPEEQAIAKHEFQIARSKHFR